MKLFFFLTVVILNFSVFGQSDNQDRLPKSDSYHKKARKHPRPILIAFDETGQMIHFPKQVIRPDDQVVFAVKVSSSYFRAQANIIYERMDSVLRFFKNIVDNQRILWALFAPDSAMINIWLEDITNYGYFKQKVLTAYPRYTEPQNSNDQGIKEKPGDSSNNNSNTGHLPKTEDIRYYPYAYDSLNKLMASIQSLRYFPVYDYFKSVLYEQFSIKIFTVSNLLSDELFLKPYLKNKHPDKNDCFWWYSDTLTVSELIGRHCNDCGKDLRFSLIIHDPWKNTVINWYNRHFVECSTNGTDLIRTVNYLQRSSSQFGRIVEIQKHYDSTWDSNIWMESINEIATKTSYDSAKRESLLDTVKKPPTNLHIKTLNDKDSINPAQYVEAIRKIPCWLLYWLWYNNGYLVINPLPVLKPDVIKLKNDSIQQLNSEIQREKLKKNFLDSARVHLTPSISMNRLDTFDMILDDLDVISTRIRNDSVKIKTINGSLKLNNDAKTFSLADRRAYVGLLPVYGSPNYWNRRWLFPRELWVQKQFSYSAALNRIHPVYRNIREREAVTELPENEHALIVVHNIPQGTKVNVSQTLTSFDDMEEFTKLVQQLLKSVDSSGLLQAALAPGLSNVTNFIKSLLRTSALDSSRENIKKKVGIVMYNYPGIDPMTLDYLNASIKKSPVLFDTNMIVVSNLQKGVDTAHGYATNIYPVIDSIAPYKVNIAIIIDSIKAKSNLNVGALRRFQLAAGFAIVRNPVQQTSIDTSGNGFKTSSSGNNASTIAGVKFYLARSYLRDGNIWPRYPLRRFSLLLAVSLPKILNNFYIGGGYDVVPGLTFTMGDNIYRQNFYQVQNARIVNSSTRYRSAGLYFGVTVNPLIFVQLVKTFFN